MPIDMSKYLGLFVSEAIEHLEALGQELVRLEKGRDTESVDSMFRHAHSVKGMASSMGFEPIATLAHRVEDLVDAFRADRSLLTQQVVDLLLAAADQLMDQVRAAGAGAPIADAAVLIAQLGETLQRLTGRSPMATRVAQTHVGPVVLAPVGAAAAGAPSGAAVTGADATGAAGEATSVVPDAAAPSPGTVSAASGADGEATEVTPASTKPSATAAPAATLPSAGTLGLPPRFAIRIKVASTCQVPGVRAFLVHRRLSGLGNIFDLRPPLEDLKAGRIPDGQVALELETQQGEAGIRQALSNVPEVELVSLKEILQDAAPPIVPPPPTTTSPETPRPVGTADQGRTVRIRTELLDYFLDTVGELLLATARIREVTKTVPQSSRPPLEEGVDRLHGLVKDLHDKVMGARMTPLAVIMDRLPRVARDVARRRDRDVDLVITGAEIELDRAIIDELGDPLLHILRNCIDHGLESAEDRLAAKKGPRGRVLVSVRRQRDRVIVEIEDDGRGMDAAKLKNAAVQRGLITQEMADRMSDREAFLLSCMPGVSTAKDVSDISGRGVGMDAVKRTVESLGGTLEIDSERGRGTRFTLRLPLTVAVVHLLLVQVGQEVFGLPIAKVLGAAEADESTLSRSRESPMLSWGNALVPVFALAELLEVPAPPRIGARPYVVMEGDGGRIALAVDRLLGQEEAVLKALSRPLDMVPGLSGVTILGSGRPVFILDVPRLIAA